MAKKLNIKKMTINDMLDTVGIMIAQEQLLSVFNNTDNIDQEDLEQLKFDDHNTMINFFRSKQENINKEKLLYCTAMNLKQYIKQNIFKPEDLETYETYKKKYEECVNLLKGSKVELPIIQTVDGMFVVKKFYTMKDLLDKKHDETELREHNLRLLEKIDKELSLEDVLAILSPDDYKEFICHYPENGDVMDYIVRMNSEQLIENYNEENPDVDEENRQNAQIMIIIDEQRKFIEGHAEKIDIDNCLLVAAYRAKKLMEIEKDEENIEILTKIMKVANENISNPKARIAGNLQIYLNAKKKYITYSSEKLKDDVTRIFNGRYYSKSELDEKKKEILDGKQEIGQIASTEYLNLLNFNKKEKIDLIRNNPKNLEYLVLFGLLEKEEIEQSLKEIGDFKFDSIFSDYLYNNGMIGKRDLVNMYLRGNIDLSKALNMDKMYDLKPEIIVEELIQYYSEMKEDENKTKKFDRYALLFREINLKGKSEEQQNYLAEQIVEEIYKLESEYSDDFKSLYKSDLLPIRTLIDWNGEKIIYDLIQNNILKPKDAKTLLMTGELDVRKAYDALKNSNLSDAEKMNFIFSSFDGVGKTEEEIKAQTDARMYLIQAIKISKDLNIVEKVEDTTHHKRGKRTETAKANQYVTDPVYRWQLFSKIDENCKSEVSSDGTVIFTLPNVNNGTVVVEKMFKSTKNGVKINYGSATYAMSQEEFLNHKAEIEQNGKINRRVLIQMREEGTADKSVHSASWGKDLKKNLGVFVENGYSEEKIAEIDNLVDRIEKARELVD